MEKRIVAFTYMILQLAKKYAENSIGLNTDSLSSIYDAEKIKIFNSNNDFNKDKCMLFPFLITIGNGKKNELLDFFEDFHPLKDGFIHKEIRENINNIPFFQFNENQLIINDEIVEKIGENRIDVEFVMNLLDYKDHHPNDVISYIDKSIENINKLIPAFMNKFHRYLSEWSKNNDVYRDYHFFYDENGDFFIPEQDVERKVLDLIKDEIKNTKFELEPEKIIA